MSQDILPHLTFLKTSLAGLMSGSDAASPAAAQGAVAARLVELLIVERTTALAFQAAAAAAVTKILPRIEKLIGEDAVADVKSASGATASRDFNRFLALCAELQPKLFALNTAEALDLCKTIALMDGDYSRKFKAAVEERVAAAATQATASPAARNARAFDQKSLLDFIKKCYSAETDLAIRQYAYIAGGYSKFTIDITLANAKLLPEHIILRGDAAGTFGGLSVVDEYRIIKTVHENGVSVPKPFALEKTGKVFGSPFMLLEKKPGRIVGHMFNLPKPNKAINQDAAVKLAALHRVPLDAAKANVIPANNISSSAHALAWIEEGYNNWRALNMPSPAFRTAFEWLRKNAHINDKVSQTLVHGDYGLNNLLIDGSELTAILDWEFVHIGNPAYDLGYFHCMAEALSSWEDFLEAYGKAGMPVPDQEQLNYHILLASTRLGVMVCQTAEVFLSNKELTMGPAMGIAGNFYDVALGRVTQALSNVL